MSRHPKEGARITYELITALTDNTVNTVHVAATVPKNPTTRQRRQTLDIDSLESVILYVAKHGKKRLRQRIAAKAAPAWDDDESSAENSDSNLAEIVDVWATLPEPIRMPILALVRGAKQV
jgi:hypothetical protein